MTGPWPTEPRGAADTADHSPGHIQTEKLLVVQEVSLACKVILKQETQLTLIKKLETGNEKGIFNQNLRLYCLLCNLVIVTSDTKYV